MIRFARGVWDFVVGDDWRTAVGVAVALAATGAVAAVGLASWWVLPVAVAALLSRSLQREARRARDA
jgi:hypothetical protein